MTTGDQLIEALPVAVYTTDAEGRITSFNQAAVDLWGQSPPPGSTWCGSFKLFTVEGEPLRHDQCPMAQSLKDGAPVRGARAILERPDGTRVPFMPYPTPLRDQAGKIIGGVNVLIDLSDRAGSEIDAARLAAIVSSSDDAIISKTLDGNITTWNVGAERIFGYAANEMIGQSILKVIPPELQSEEKDIIARLARGERIEHFETVRLAKDGKRIDISLTVSPIRDGTGRIVGASKVARDVSERRRAEDVQRLLIDELNHRIKNTLATVQAIATQTLRRSGNASDFVTSFNGRILALSRAHGLLTGGSFQGADILQLVREQLMLGGDGDPRIAWSGPSLTLEAQAALHLALVLHELGTNARKHGALSSPNGRVLVSWEVHTNGGRKLALKWEERGGPPVKAPSSRGFGTILIEQSLQAHGGEVAVNYAEIGVTCHIALPLSEIRDVASMSRPIEMLRALKSVARPQGLTGKRIFVVEDEPLIAMVLADYLGEAGCHVVGPAQSLPKAKALVESETFDAALVDGNLAGQPVTDIAVALTKKGIPFVFVTGYGREGLPAGFQDAPIIEKPFTQEQVIGALERLFNAGVNVVALKQPRREG